MSLLSQFLLGSPPSLVQLDLLEISHPNFTQTYRLVRNNAKGVSVMHEGPAGPFAYEYLPMRILQVGSGNNLDQALRVVLGDAGQVIQAEIAVVTAANGMDTRPTVAFRAYRSDDLAAPMFGPLTLEMGDITTSSSEGNSFVATPPKVNVSRTGINYTVEQFPTLAGF